MAESDQDNTGTTEQPADAYKEALAQITNPEGNQKYKDVTTALESIKPKDTMILQLQEEVAEAKLKQMELEDTLSKKESAEELVRKVMENQRQQQNTDTPTGEDAEKTIDIGELVRQELKGLQAEDSKKTNRTRVASVLAESYGDKANDVLASKMKELDISPEFFKGVIEQSPLAALELLGLKAKAKAAPVKPQGSVRAESFSETAPEAASSVMLATSKEQGALWDRLMQEAQAS